MSEKLTVEQILAEIDRQAEKKKREAEALHKKEEIDELFYDPKKSILGKDYIEKDKNDIDDLFERSKGTSDIEKAVDRRLGQSVDERYSQMMAQRYGTPKYVARHEKKPGAFDLQEELAAQRREPKPRKKNTGYIEDKDFDYSKPVKRKYEDFQVNYSKKQKPISHAKTDALGMEVSGFKTVLNVLRALVIILVFFGISAFLIFAKRPTVSKEENRNLAKMPKFELSSYLDGKYTSGVQTYFDDTVPERSFFKSAISRMTSLFGIDYGSKGGDGAVLIGSGAKKETLETKATTSSTTISQTSGKNAASNTTTKTTTKATTKATDDDDDENVQGEMSNNILIVNKRALMLFGGSRERADEYAAAVNKYKKELGDGVCVYSMIDPTAGTFYIPKKYRDLTNSETEYIDYIDSKLDSSIKQVDVYSALLEHKDENIYARTDHHWLPLGAYYAAQEFCDVAGTDFAPLSKYDTKSKNDYVGTMYGYSGSDVIKNNPEEFKYYIPKNKYTTTYYDTDLTNGREGSLLLNIDNLDPVSYYLVFMGGDEKVTHIKTDVKNGRNLLMIKDSYGNATVPCLTSSFENIYVVDMRYFTDTNIIDFAKAVDTTDLLFNMDTYSAMGANCGQLDVLLNQTTNGNIKEKLDTYKKEEDN